MPNLTTIMKDPDFGARVGALHDRWTTDELDDVSSRDVLDFLFANEALPAPTEEDGDVGGANRDEDGFEYEASLVDLASEEEE